MLTEKQKNFILYNLDVLDDITMQEIIEKLIDNMSKEYASEIVGQIIEYLNDIDIGDYANIEDCGDR